MNITLWVVAGLLALVYVLVGCVKLLRGKALASRMQWAAAVPDVVVRFIGLAELAGALGLILPQATGEFLFLTPIAAAGLVLLQLLAILVHLRRRETRQIAINVILLVLAVVVAVGRGVQWLS
jgi:hypothetical protein